MATNRSDRKTNPYVQKIRVTARVSQPNQEPRDGAFLLFPGDQRNPTGETLLELLNSDRMVIPFLPSEDKNVLLLTRVNIDWVVVGKDVNETLVYPAEYAVTSEQRVDLRLIDETRVHAVLCWDSPDGEARLSDFLNRPQLFIPAKTNFGTLLVNKLRVRETRLEEGSERRAGGEGESQAA